MYCAMSRRFLLSCAFLLILPCKGEVNFAVSTEEPWDLDGPCQPYVENLSLAIGKIVQCAANWTIPPKVCTNCIDEYINFRQVEYNTKNLGDGIRARDNKSCSDVIYSSYLLSYVSELSELVTARVWDKSRCDSCITISWNFTGGSTYAYTEHTETFADKLYMFRDCISNYTDDASLTEALEGWSWGGAEVSQNASALCTQCKDSFDDLYRFYWDIYIKPGIQFCVDCETTMNDTARLWNDVWHCSKPQDKTRDATLVMVSAGALLLFTLIFYSASYIQGGGQERIFQQYSHRAEPRADRFRLMTSSASDAALASRGHRSNRSSISSGGGPRMHMNGSREPGASTGQ